MKITDNTKAVLVEANRRTSAGLEELEPVILRTAKQIVTVKSGDLQESISAEVGENKLVVGSPLPYAPKVEMDKPFLRPAVLQNKAKIKRVFRA